MSSLNVRQEAVRAIAGAEYRLNRVNFKETHIKDLFGVNVFNEEEQRQRLPKPVFQALQLQPCFLHLRLRHRATWGQRFLPLQPPVDDGDLLVELALALAHVGEIDGLQGLRDIGEHVALLHRCAELRKTTAL